MENTGLSETDALAMLAAIPLLGAMKIRLLIRYFGSPQNAVAAKPEQLVTLPGFGPKILANWQNSQQKDSWRKDLELAERHGAKLVPYTDPRFPKRLLEITDHPVLLYVMGNLKALEQQSLAVVGTRQPSLYGQEMALHFSESLAQKGFTIVSGLARGIDTLAHRGALKAGRTVAVIGSGLANIYPRENSALAQAICKEGALISEFPMAMPPNRANFPQRNRIVSGMTLGTVLVEAPLESGAMITMDRAYRQKRKLFALPGRADQESFQGNHLLIKRGQAVLVESAQEVAEHFGTLFCAGPPAVRKKEVELDKEEERVWRLMPQEETTFDEIFRLADVPASKLNVLLMSLVIKKAIKEYPGKIYKRSPIG